MGAGRGALVAVLGTLRLAHYMCICCTKHRFSRIPRTVNLQTIFWCLAARRQQGFAVRSAIFEQCTGKSLFTA